MTGVPALIVVLVWFLSSVAVIAACVLVMRRECAVREEPVIDVPRFLHEGIRVDRELMYAEQEVAMRVAADDALGRLHHRCLRRAMVGVAGVGCIPAVVVLAALIGGWIS